MRKFWICFLVVLCWVVFMSTYSFSIIWKWTHPKIEFTEAVEPKMSLTLTDAGLEIETPTDSIRLVDIDENGVITVSPEFLGYTWEEETEPVIA